MYAHILYGHNTIHSDVATADIVVSVATSSQPPEGPILRYCPILLEPFGQRFRIFIFVPSRPSATIWSSNIGLDNFPYVVNIDHPLVTTHTLARTGVTYPWQHTSGKGQHVFTRKQRTSLTVFTLHKAFQTMRALLMTTSMLTRPCNAYTS